MIIEFHDKNGRCDHVAFRDWRMSHCCDENGENARDGYFLSIQRSDRAELHTWECRQRAAGGLNWDGLFGTEPTDPPSLTKTRKVCSEDQTELLVWASANEIDVVSCAHCLSQPQSMPNGKVMGSVENPQAIEGIARETAITTRSRSVPLRRAALERAAGICEACGTDYSKLGGGLGRRVLEVHHRLQLALAVKPVTNGWMIWRSSVPIAI